MKRLIGVILCILFIVSLCSCGLINYEKIGYDKAQTALEALKTSDDYEETVSYFQMAVSLFGKDYVKSLIYDVVEESVESELEAQKIDLSDEDAQAVKDGVNRALSEFIDNEFE